ncbi:MULTISPECIES: phosphodiester glycosidase family protein [unclassified Coleofasciculus]|uniref:phosphodiester glycosidase family protein n=1 Tax=Cyanophyceae TaxID=3028117 RepID=UPI001684A450|nr:MULTISPECIES: phosphodiester glycosidase family protein [unclassified Coleofasciculus]MBD1880415.1 phosphodiester glycosidase family protein [Coleofasciculus sp. FACHB-T130]MBD1901195.1 phosphodiester glycosidase family protein [Coleofasciculus sp. FACHB-125]
MFTKAKFLATFLVIFIILSVVHVYSKNTSTSPQVQAQKIISRENTANNLCDCQSQECQFSIEFIRTDHQGNTKAKGANYVLIFDPKSPKLDFKVSLALAHEIYAKDAKGRFRKEYVPKQFHEIIADDNAKLNGKKPIAAINGDYIDPENKPQGLNISRGVEYSGLFKDKRSSFGISEGTKARKATIQIGKRNEQNLNYNLVGGNGRFYKDGIFKDICNDLGEYACQHETSRSMAAITSKGYVILLVNNVETDGPLYPDKFDDVLKGISKNHCLGNIQEAMLFDGGFSTAFYYNNKIYVENSNPIGSVFLIYKTE